jgi:antibiotic biosynthesis monooxygenase (ABM) superfamily enzyme
VIWRSRSGAGIVANEVPLSAPSWKIALLTWIGLWPTVTVVMWAVQPLLAALPVPVQTLLMTALIVPLMAWVHMPLLTRLFRGWLARPF